MKKLTIVLSILIIITIALGITYFSIIGFNQKDRLIREIKVASQTDVENLNTNTKTKGQYKIIEKDIDTNKVQIFENKSKILIAIPCKAALAVLMMLLLHLQKGSLHGYPLLLLPVGLQPLAPT